MTTTQQMQLELFTPELLQTMKADSECFSERIQFMLKTMLDMGASPQFIAALLDLTGINKTLQHYFGAPIVCTKSQWKDTLPDWLTKAVYKERFELICEEYSTGTIGQEATLADVVCVLMPASLEAPPNYRMANMYCYVGRLVSLKHQPGATPDRFDGIPGCDKLGPDEARELAELRREIRRKVVRNHW